MKKMGIAAALLFLLCGCAQEPVLETVADDLIQPVMAQPRQTTVQLPDDAVAPVLESDSAQMYLCQDYELVIETLSSGDLDATVRTISGYPAQELTLLKTQQGDADRYDFVWVSAGETGERLGRGVILDDGNYHYCMSVLRDADTTETSQISWRNVFESFALEDL